MQLEDIYKMYINDLYRYLYSLSKDHYMAEDLVQEAYYRAFIALEEDEIVNIKAWLFKVAYHAFIDYQRKSKRVHIESQMEKHIVPNQRTPEKSVLEKESLRLLFEDLGVLKEMEKHAVVLCDLHGLPYQEAAKILGLNLNTFKSHLFRGRKKLLALVKERMSRDEGQ
ncbi:sigma-70 family RNA polymerase sigma factor [Mesobacillus foraminis]|uniref:RNA polymerase sigma-70 factor (ECF subfamily) n=1 Tax=Mesobacillus foraminis TaxID=279826 RepID=A0A4R2BGI4_9BACI|nr:sigma-70 family RNA polymerase sigma factor [Mesobacillus foraminis]TCN26148.1 RNA polymerase sigma-70 factor (ECF subfamily) [Mesobacillus foraminis]